MASHFKKKEGWWGVAVTLLVCGAFLWWWFQPVPVDGTTARDPLYWLGLAREERGPAPPSAGDSFDPLVVVLWCERAGKETAATAVANDWLPASWRSALTAGSEPGEPAAPEGPPASDPAFAAVLANLRAARAALDQLEIERAREVLRAAVTLAEAMTVPQRDQALWLVSARQARNGFAADARETRGRIDPAVEVRSLPPWLIFEFMDADMAAPVLGWCEAHPDEAPRVLAGLVAVVRKRLAHREAGEFAAHGPRADPTSAHSGADSALLAIHQAVGENRLKAAGDAARQLPSGRARAAGFLTIARTLAWNAESPAR